MANGSLNNALYEKMCAEQEEYRKKLLAELPEEIVRQAYEYAVREDILFSLEYNCLSDRQAEGMLRSSHPLADVYQRWEKKETGYMEDIWNTLEECAEEKVNDPGKSKRSACRI